MNWVLPDPPKVQNNNSLLKGSDVYVIKPNPVQRVQESYTKELPKCQWLLLLLTPNMHQGPNAVYHNFSAKRKRELGLGLQILCTLLSHQLKMDSFSPITPLL